MDRQLTDYLPLALSENREFKEALNAQQSEVSDLWDAMQCALNDQFVSDAKETGILRWEKVFSISPKGTDTLDIRRFRIRTRLSERSPYTALALNNQLASLCGEKGYRLGIENEAYTLNVRVELTAKGKFDEVKSLLNRIAPANLSIDLDLLYNQYLKFATYTYQSMSGYTYEQLRNEVIS